MITEKEFTELFNRNTSKVYRLCMGYAAGNQDLAKEWLQETFIKVWKHRHSFKGNSSIETWLYRIAVNVCLEDLRKTKKDLTINEQLLSSYTAEEPKENNEENIKKMFHCIDQLKVQNKTLILLELENIPQATMAETLGLAYGTLRTRLTRIRKSLLKCIKNGK